MNVMSAGPTSVPEQVRLALSSHFTNTDLDPAYTVFQKTMEQKISKLVHTQAHSFVMLGEPLAGLDGASVSFTEQGTRVLVLVNGVFSKYFKDFTELYGANAVVLNFNDRLGIDYNELEEFLETDSDFTFATFVHCETPTGVTNDIHKIGQLLNHYGIMSIVDSVSGLGGEDIRFDEAKIDCLISGSQKCLSAPVGLTTITLSDQAVAYLKARKSPIKSFYTNFLNYLVSEEFDFPYTQSENLVYALNEALDLVLAEDFVNRHKLYAQRTRAAITASGLEVYAQTNFSNTVTTILLPNGVSGDKIQQILYDRCTIVSGGLDHLRDHAIRIAHMGENIRDERRFVAMLRDLSVAMNEAGCHLAIDLDQAFMAEVNKA